MRDVARAAQVSQSTVSRILSAGNGVSVPISAQTTKRVLETVAELGYQPNLHARSLRGQKTQMIAMMIADIANPFYHILVRRVQDIAREHGYDMLIANTDHDPEFERHFLDGIIRRPVDGVILTPYHLKEHEISRMMTRTGVRVTVIGQHLNLPEVDRVFADDGLATHDAVRWLIQERGHRRIAYLSVPGTVPSRRREAGYRGAMREAGLNLPDVYVQPGAFTSESGDAAAAFLLALPEPPTAIVACNDLMALGCLEAANRLGVRVPEALAVVGFDDIPEARRTTPKLTTIAQFPAEMGEYMARALFERINSDEPLSARSYEVPCRLIVRESA